MINSHNYGAHENLRELKNEFNCNYKKYLEMSLLQSLVENALQEGSTIDAKLDEKIKDKYLKSSLIAGYSSTGPNSAPKDGLMGQFSINDFRAPPLDLEAKSYLVEKIKELLENRLAKISSFVTDPSELEDNDYTETRRKLNQLFEELSINKQKSDKSNEEVKLKYEHCLNVAFEISKLLNAILVNYRLGFYAQENKERCEKKILEFKVLLGKILSSKSSILSEVYSEDKLKALRVISDQIDMKSNVTREKLNRMTSLIASYNSLGKEFDPILAQYRQLKNELERKNFTLNTLKKDNIM